MKQLTKAGCAAHAVDLAWRLRLYGYCMFERAAYDRTKGAFDARIVLGICEDKASSTFSTFV